MAHKLLPSTSVEQLKHYLRLFKLNFNAMLEYEPKEFSGKIVFFVAQERDDVNLANPQAGWFAYAREGINVIEVPGNHITMNYPPNVELVAKRLLELL